MGDTFRGTPPSPARLARLARFIAKYEAGMTMQQIADEEGISKQRVRQILDPKPKRGVRLPSRPLHRQGTPEQAVHDVIVAAEMVHDWWTKFRGDPAGRDHALTSLGDALERYHQWIAEPTEGGQADG